MKKQRAIPEPFETFTQKTEFILDQISDIDTDGYAEREDKKAAGFDSIKRLIKAYDPMIRESDLAHSRMQTLAAKSRRLYSHYYSTIEVASSLEAIKAGKYWQRPTFVSHNDTLGEQEIEIMDISENSTIAFIGGGPFPWSIIKYLDRIGSNPKVTSIDVLPEAIKLSHGLLKSQGFADKISLLPADARDVDYGNFSHIILSAMAVPKKEIIERIIDTAQPNAMLVSRSSEGLNCFFYETFIPQSTKLKPVTTLPGCDDGELISHVNLINA
ncbi:MAG: nicotianamine synthase family protein [Candidatus Levyibacteriota bacterium]